MRLLPIMTDREMFSFEEDCFRNWLNIVDARMGYDERREASTVATWRACFDVGMSENEAIAESATWLVSVAVQSALNAE